MADEQPEQRIVPEGIPAAIPYADSYVVRHIGDAVTLYLLRVPPVFTEAQQKEVFGGPELHAPVVSSVTLPADLALDLAGSIQKLIAKKS